MSIPADTPAEVMIEPSSTQRTPRCTCVCGKVWAKRSRLAQCVVALQVVHILCILFKRLFTTTCRNLYYAGRLATREGTGDERQGTTDDQDADDDVEGGVILKA